MLLESGRQALAALAIRLRSSGFTDLLMPSYFCDSMLAPFRAERWTVDYATVGPDWQIKPPSKALADPQRTLVLTMSYFGVDESEEWLNFLADSVASGARVLSDETHRVLSTGLMSAHYRVGSLRKMLPVPDGAFLTGMELRGLPRGFQGQSRLAAMRAKSEYLEKGSHSGYLALFAAAEKLTELNPTPRAASESAQGLLHRLNYPIMSERRVRNSAILQLGLKDTGYRVTNASAPVPSHCVIAGSDILGLRRHLIERNIYCPVHWPPAKFRAPGVPWRADVLSIPIDHRYDALDMADVVCAIQEFESKGRSSCA